jgi:hypothetical protein
MMGSRQQPSKSNQAKIFLASRRRCCLCVFLNHRDEVRQGQIAHLNRDASDSRLENLVFLCFEHHDDYDTRRSQSKGFLAEEVREYRDKLYQKYNDTKPTTDQTVELNPLPEISEYQDLQDRFPDKLKFISEPWRYPLWQAADEPEYFAYKARNRFDGVCLVERIDIPDGRIVIVCIQVPGNPGNSITNCVEELCFQVCERFEIPAERLVWLEHYDIHGAGEWNSAEFEKGPPNSLFTNPTWKEMTLDMWKDLQLRPNKRMRAASWNLESKVRKLFPWPP